MRTYGADGGREMRSATVVEIVPIDRSDDDMGKPKLRHGLPDMLGFVRIERARQARLHVAERASARAGVAHDHERGVRLVPAFADIGAARLFADRVQAVLADDVTRAHVARAHRRLDADPFRLALDGRVGPVRLLGMAHGAVFGVVVDGDHDSIPIAYGLGNHLLWQPAAATRRFVPPLSCVRFAAVEEELLADTLPPYDPTRARRSLFTALADARLQFGRTRAIMTDGDERTLSYEEIVRAALALGHALKTGTKRGEAVGVLLPTGIGSVIAVLALSAYGRVPAMLNFTAGEQSLRTALKMANIKRVVTAHRFIELGKFEALEAWMKTAAKLVYLEDVRQGLSLFDKVTAAVGSILPGLVATRVSPDAPAVILFTSGTEGEPKGVALSHANILANVEQVRAHIAFYPTDVVFNPLPTFHSFGLTVGAFMPLFLGVKVVQHPTPRQPHEIVRRIKEHGATILLATDTFVSQYARVAEAEELSSLRLAVCGAERLRDETRQLFKRKYTVELLEGYGVTEAAPVLAANQSGMNRAGTVGHMLPGDRTAHRAGGGHPRWWQDVVRGPNIMLGYMQVR